MQINNTLNEWGRAAVIIKSDQEPAIIDFKRAIREQREHPTLEEQSKREDHQGNGHAESAVRDMAGMTRTLRAGLWHHTKR